MSSSSDAKPYLTAKDIASLLMVSPNTIRLWTEKGLLKSELTLGGHRRFLRSDVDQLLQERARKAAAPAAPKPPSVLIIEDESELAHTLAEGLRQALPGIAIQIAADGFTGGLLASQHKPDLVLLDLTMPGMDGVEVCRLLKSQAQTRDIRIIAITGYANADQVEAVIAEGAEDCLFKPLRMPKLLQAIGLSATAAGARVGAA